MNNGNLDYNFNDHKIHKTKMNNIFLHLQKKHKFNQNNYLSIIKRIHSKEEWELKFIVSELAIKFLILQKKISMKIILVKTYNSLISNTLTRYMKILRIM